MKQLFSFLLFLSFFVSFSQNPTMLVSACTEPTVVTDYTYFVDIEGKFDKFVGTWKYTNGSQLLTFKISKVTQQYFPEERIFRDYLVGDYSYSSDGGNSYVVNSILSPINPDPNVHPMYSPCVEEDSVRFIFKDIALNKGYCYATFTFLPGSTTQLQVQIRNPAEIPGRMAGEPAYNYDFITPTDIIVIKQ
ncbi:MAG TPA: DUF6705 family protein [Flavobacterium sp.]